ncbi:hypothetical protein BLA39750_03095 [Burkholderia lata]|uniref:Uncharacterized protein n=1 Tax=Burkholderia lata (strain ATCC 17760 / DSM 23089 / LMG 22485 / NCIMB 9086 / R18194 / 383) TaxID=482957 RepID=A0A6P2XJR7_BURL3|nr:hypothetical protein BLA39750_03095 [Burkholderia lata]
MPRIGAAGDDAGTAAAADAVSGDGNCGGSAAVWQADSARTSTDANRAMSDLDMVSYACSIFASGDGSVKLAWPVKPFGATGNAA